MRSNALDPRSHRYRPFECGRGSATLVWVSGRMFGCQFDAPISPAVLSPARLRSAIDIAEASPHSLLCSVAWLQFCRKFEAPAHRQRLSQASMAERFGASGPSISGWEKGCARPKEDRLVDLANLLGVPVAQLLVDPQPHMIQDMIDTTRDQIARATGGLPRGFGLSSSFERTSSAEADTIIVGLPSLRRPSVFR